MSKNLPDGSRLSSSLRNLHIEPDLGSVRLEDGLLGWGLLRQSLPGKYDQ